MHIVNSAVYAAFVGLLFRIVGNRYDRSRFSPDCFPYRCANWEQEGRIYRKIGIHRWKERLPDMSRICRDMYPKQVTRRGDNENLKRLVQETCVAECVHYQLMLASVPVIFIGEDAGWFLYGLCVLGNLPFVLIQRYNRPRLLRALKKVKTTV